jgi:hypothetical protein
MQKPLLKNLENEIDSLIDSSTPIFHTNDAVKTAIMNLLEETYRLIHKLEESRFRTSMSKIEHNINTIKPYINFYKSMHKKVLYQEDKELSNRYQFAFSMYESFLKRPDQTLSSLKRIIYMNKAFGNSFDSNNPSLKQLKEINPDLYHQTKTYLENEDLLMGIYDHLSSYQISKEKIIKSASLRLFNFFETNTYTHKKSLADKIGHLFIILGETISVSPKRANNLRTVGVYDFVDLHDYGDNKKMQSEGLALHEMFIDLFAVTGQGFQKQGFEKEGDFMLLFKDLLEIQKTLGILKL